MVSLHWLRAQVALGGYPAPLMQLTLRLKPVVAEQIKHTFILTGYARYRAPDWRDRRRLLGDESSHRCSL